MYTSRIATVVPLLMAQIRIGDTDFLRSLAHRAEQKLSLLTGISVMKLQAEDLR